MALYQLLSSKAGGGSGECRLGFQSGGIGGWNGVTKQRIDLDAESLANSVV